MVREVFTIAETTPASRYGAPVVAREASGVASRPVPSIVTTPGPRTVPA